MTPIDLVLSQLPDAKPTANGWEARCPGHADRVASLSVAEGDDSKALLNCHAGCKTADIVKAMGLTMASLHVKKSSSAANVKKRSAGNVPSTPKAATSPKSAAPAQVYPSSELAIQAMESIYGKHGKHSAQWTYFDELGQPERIVLRWDRPGQKKVTRAIIRMTDGWYTSGATASPYGWGLYRRPELLQRPGERVYVCEGEKASEAVRAVGLLGTTTPQGSSSAPKADWRPLAGREVIILPDADDAGETYATDAEDCLQNLSPPAVVKVVRLPELVFGSGDDMVEFCQLRGGDAQAIKAELEALADDAQAQTPAPSGTSVDAPADNANAAADTSDGASKISSAIEHVNVVEPDDGSSSGPRTPEPFKPFPIDALPKQMAAFCHDAAKAIGCDGSYIALPMLAEFAAAIGNSRRIQLKYGWTEPAILWCLIIGLSGSTKSPALELAMRPARKWQEQKMREYKLKMAEYRRELERHEALKQASRRGSKAVADLPDEPEAPICERTWMDDATIEAVVHILQGNPRGVMLIQDELTLWLNFDRYSKGGGIVAKWLEMHGGRALVVDRRTSETLCVPRAAVSVAGGIQPGVLARHIGQEHRDNGLLARLLMTMPPRQPKQWTEAEIDPSAEAAMVTLYERLQALQPAMDSDGEPQPVIVTFTPHAKRIWITFYNEHNAQMAMLDGEMAAAWSKLEGYAARLALVVHLGRYVSGETTSSDIDDVSVSAGITLSRWFSAEAKRVYSMLSGSEDDRRQQQWVELIQRHGGSISQREWQRLRSHSTSADAETELAELIDAGWGKWDAPAPGPRGGRPAKRFVLTATAPASSIESPDDDGPAGGDETHGPDADDGADHAPDNDTDWGEI